MSISQINVFVQSKPGHLSRILEIFEDAGVSVRGFSAADTGDYGIVRFIVDDPDAALSALKEHNAACSISDVLCARLDDTPGELARVLGVFASRGVNVQYCYSMISTYIIVSVKDVDQAEQLLEGAPVELIEQADLASMTPYDKR